MIRRYHADDCGAVIDVWARASAVAHPFLRPEFLEQERQNIRELYMPNAETWVWESDGQVVGYVALLGKEIGGLFVDPDFHRGGIGRGLVEWARDLHGDLEVEVFEKNVIGRAFYDRLGFQFLRRSTHRETGFDLLRLRLGDA